MTGDSNLALAPGDVEVSSTMLRLADLDGLLHRLQRDYAAVHDDPVAFLRGYLRADLRRIQQIKIARELMAGENEYSITFSDRRRRPLRHPSPISPILCACAIMDNGPLQ